MSAPTSSRSALRRAFQFYATGVRWLTMALSFFAGAGILFMVGIICVDVVLRKFGSPLKGTFDLVRIAGALTLACALPYTTAVKGHVAIEYFFLKLNRPGRVMVDSIARLIVIALFLFLAWESFVYGRMLLRSGTVTSTLQLPFYWVSYVISFCCLVVVLVKIHNLLNPGREMIKP